MREPYRMTAKNMRSMNTALIRRICILFQLFLHKNGETEFEMCQCELSREIKSLKQFLHTVTTPRLSVY